MKKRLTILLAAGLLLYPFAAGAIDNGTQSSETQQIPPVAQTLVREGDFAIKLAAKLDLGSPTDEASAEDMLAKAGVVPLNGWISDYPVTPVIVGQLQESIAKAAAEGNLPMNAQEATRGLYSLAAELNLPSPAGPESAPAEEQKAPAEKSDPTVINNYYYNQGPPVVTYYPPPAEYVYLYDWVPYPTWWFGFWFPGFFISHSFTTTVVVSGAVVVNRPFIGTRIAIVSNRIIDPVTRVSAVVSPVVRTGRGGVRPVTTLRTESGRTFGTLAELRRDAGSHGRQVVTPGTATNSTSRREGFRSPEARRSAESIFSRSVEGTRDNRGREGAARSMERRSVAPSTSGRSFNGPARDDNRRFVAPSQSGRSFSGSARGDDRRVIAPRMSEQRSVGPSDMRRSGQSVRQFAPQRAPARSFFNPSSGGGGNSTNSFSSGKGGKGGSGRGFSGGNCSRGRC
jgi:hypothetical protein